MFIATVWEAIKNFFQKFWHYICIGFTATVTWFKVVDIQILEKIFYLISIFILTIGLFKVIFKKKKKLPKSPAEKTLDLAANPEKAAEKIIDNCRKTKREVYKMKKFFKWLWANKVSLSSILLSAIGIFFSCYVVTEQYVFMIPWFAVHKAVGFVVVGVLAAAIVVLTSFGIVNKFGVESVAEFAARLEEHKAKVAAALTPEQKAELKTKLKVFNNGLAEAKSTLKVAKEGYANLQILIGSGLATASQVNESNTLASTIATCEKTIAQYETKIGEVETALKA